MSTILAFGAHSDDIDLRAGATFAKYLREGKTIVYVVVTTSASGIPKLSPNEAFIIRQNEAKEAAKLYNTEPIFLNFEKTVTEGPSDELPTGMPYIATSLRNNDALQTIKSLIEKHQPEIIFTHNPNDLHEDHYHTSALVYRAYQSCKSHVSSRLLLWETGSKGKIIDFIPNIYIPVTDEDLVLKDKAIKSHTSQYAIFPWFETFAYDNALYWGEKANTAFAEAFIEVF
ncbi:MAG TPA: PIG-L deacetylase family protein [Candidatus Saccharimonadales bacterium]|nr:PIG-L deacetylase family protein [Candidatus Saccharimonadales bacterium]